jgi:hypothetical protein
MYVHFRDREIGRQKLMAKSGLEDQITNLSIRGCATPKWVTTGKAAADQLGVVAPPLSP